MTYTEERERFAEFRDQVLEEAASVAETKYAHHGQSAAADLVKAAGMDIALAIRALKRGP